MNGWQARRAFGAALSAVVIALVVGGAHAQAAFPGVDGDIAFTSNRDVGAGDIYTVPPSGGGAARLTISTSSSEPAYSPDGTKIAFVDGDKQIVVMNYDGTGRTVLTSSATSKTNPAWSPDGTKIAYEANSFDVDGQTDLELWSINADGSNRQQLTTNAFLDTEPAWSPAGTRIAFVGQRPGDTNRNIYVMNAGGGNEVSLTPNDASPCSPCYGGNDDSPNWGPDGSSIVYVNGPGDIWTVDPDTLDKLNLSDATSVSFEEAVYSPQGTRIAAVGVSPATTDRDIWVMNADGSNPTEIEGDPAFDSSPDWQPITPPVCSNTAASTGHGVPVTFALPCTGVDLVPGLVAGPVGGQVTLGSGVSATYAPSPGFAGIDQFTYRARNVAGSSANATASVSVAAAPPVVPPVVPPNSFEVVKTKLNKKRGTAALTVAVPAPGSLVLAGADVKEASSDAAAAGETTIKVAAKGKKKQKLSEKGKVSVKAELTFTPDGGTPRTGKTKVKLLKK